MGSSALILHCFFLQYLMNGGYRRWNEGRMVGPRKPFEPDEAWRIAGMLQAAQAWRDLALLATGVDTMLRASDLLRLRVRDVTDPTGAVRETLLFRQQKTGGAVALVLTAFSREALARWIERSGKRAEDFLFTRVEAAHGPAISASTYRRIVKGWAAMIGLDSSDYSTHSIRRTKPIHMYRSGCRIADISRLLGHKSTDVTLHYLGITSEHLRLQALRFDVFSGEAPETETESGQGESRGFI